ncbi:CPBP family intramembrane metalloprotease [Candidatus Dojkabacteria bacterium]|nr:CPBP family intramembrane metalloprotease [Candidatus Dojkabacteria bacterium]
MEKINLKGIIWFIALTYIPTIIFSVFLWGSSINFNNPEQTAYRNILAIVMFFPLISALIVKKFILHESLKSKYFKRGKPLDYVKTGLFIPLLFILVYGLTSLLYKPDLEMQQFMSTYGVTSLPMPALLFILVIFLSTITIAPILNIIPSFGEEFGWRGFLLPHLLPLGRKRALIISSLIWACWHLPFIWLLGFGGYYNPFIGGFIYVTVVTCLGIYIGNKTIENKSVLLASYMHGVFNAQGYGIWSMIFFGINPMIGGIAGLISLVVFIPLAIFTLYKTSS